MNIWLLYLGWGLFRFHRSYKMVVCLTNGYYNASPEIFFSCCFKIIRWSNRTSGIKFNFIQFIWINGFLIHWRLLQISDPRNREKVIWLWLRGMFPTHSGNQHKILTWTQYRKQKINNLFHKYLFNFLICLSHKFKSFSSLFDILAYKPTAEISLKLFKSYTWSFPISTLCVWGHRPWNDYY